MVSSANETAKLKFAITGCAGVPANYGGFETLAENLVRFHASYNKTGALMVYCSSKSSPNREHSFLGAQLRYVDLDANGVQSILYDIFSLIHAVLNGCNRLLLLGVSGAPILPFLRIFTSVKIITNVDGIEWKREKWTGIAKCYLRLAERLAVWASHTVVADNQAIATYLKETYACDAKVIPYGGDHAVQFSPNFNATEHLPPAYALGLCRIEPENNVAMILEGFRNSERPLVFVGNWDKTSYGRALKAEYANDPNIFIHDPVYDPRDLRAIRMNASLYVHGHSAGGTNPALVEMMHFGVPVIAHNNLFNHYTTEGKALYFSSSTQLRQELESLDTLRAVILGESMLDIARRRYTWDQVGQAYFELLSN